MSKETTPEERASTPEPTPAKLAAEAGTPLSASERWKSLVVFFTILTTVIVAIVAGLQAEASIRGSAANRDSQYYAIKIAGELQRSGLQGNYDMALFTNTIQDRLESTVLQLVALQMKSQEDEEGANAAQLQAEKAKARADASQAASFVYNDPRYAPKSVNEAPDLTKYITDLTVPALELLKKQNAAADEYNKWSEKADAYTSVLTVLAIALFLFGLAQALAARLRFLFTSFGVVAAGAAVLWALTILLG